MTAADIRKIQSFNQWIKSMDFVLIAHEFKIELGTFEDVKGRSRHYTDVLGMDWNGYYLHTPAFPKTFVEHLRSVLEVKVKKDGRQKMKIEYGCLQSLYADFLVSIERKLAISQVLEDLENNPVT